MQYCHGHKTHASDRSPHDNNIWRDSLHASFLQGTILEWPLASRAPYWREQWCMQGVSQYGVVMEKRCMQGVPPIWCYHGSKGCLQCSQWSIISFAAGTIWVGSACAYCPPLSGISLGCLDSVWTVVVFRLIMTPSCMQCCVSQDEAKLSRETAGLKEV